MPTQNPQWVFNGIGTRPQWSRNGCARSTTVSERVRHGSTIVSTTLPHRVHNGRKARPQRIRNCLTTRPHHVHNGAAASPHSAYNCSMKYWQSMVDSQRFDNNPTSTRTLVSQSFRNGSTLHAPGVLSHCECTDYSVLVWLATGAALASSLCAMFRELAFIFCHPCAHTHRAQPNETIIRGPVRKIHFTPSAVDLAAIAVRGGAAPVWHPLASFVS